MVRVTDTRYDSRFSQNLAEMVADEAAGRADKLSRARVGLAYADARFGEFADLLEAAKPQTLGYAWQNADLDIWYAAGHEAQNLGSAPKVDGLLCGQRVQYKVSRLSGSGRFAFDKLPSPRSNVVNLLLFADSAVDMLGWPMFVGTTADLKAAASELRSRNPQRRVTVSQSAAGTWSFGASALEIARFGQDLPGFMLLREYIGMRNSCSYC